MKRTTRKVEKRTFTLKNAIPRFVSIVGRGANLAPLAELRYSENETFSDVEINQIVFSKDKFDRQGVEQYLTENDYEDFSIEEDEATFIVPGLDSNKFEEVSNIEYVDGVKFYIGKLKESVEGQATTNVVDADILDFSQETTEVVQENAPDALNAIEAPVTVSEDAENVQEGDLSVNDLEGNTNEEAKDESEVSSGEESQADFTDGEKQEEVVVADQVVNEPTEHRVFNDGEFRRRAERAYAVFTDELNAARTECFSLPEEVVTYTAEEVQAKVDEAVAAAIEQFNTNKIEETIENPIDETTILVQNSQAVTTEETSIDSKDEKTEKFSQRKSNDLFGLR